MTAAADPGAVPTTLTAGSISDGAAAPYPGLRPFQPDEADIFCGRETSIDEVIQRLGARNLVLVHGGSGCGKSSLVRAGVLPLLARRHALAGTGFAFAIMRPSEGPRRRLAMLLAEHLGMPADAEGGAHATEDDAVDRATRWWSEQIIFTPNIITLIEAAIKRRGLQSFVLVVDQFEEIFPWARERGRSDVDLLVNVLARVGAPDVRQCFFILVTMRSDYIGQCAQFGRLGPVINDCQYYLRNLDDAGIAGAIGGPALMFGGTIDQALLSRLMFVAASQTDPLPILQHSLMRMAEPYLAAPGGWKLTLGDLSRVSTAPDGRDSNALSVHANAVLASFAGNDPAREEVARRVFRSLFEVDVGETAIRRPSAFRTLVAVSGAGERDVAALVAAFSAPGVNLLVDTPGGDGERTIDISHEALLRNWDRMIGEPGSKQPGWIREEIDDTLTWRMLARYAQDRSATIDARILAQLGRFMSNLERAPERARRYLLRPTGAVRVEDEPEWKSVRSLMRRSTWWLVGMVAVTIMLGAVSLFWIVQSGRQRDEIAALNLQKRALQAVQAAALARKHAESSALALKRADTENVDLTAALSALSRADAGAKVQQAEEVATTSDADAALAGDGYIWVGDRSVANLRDLLGARVNGAEAKAGRHYVLGWPVKVRAALPDAANVSGREIGSLARNAAVLALEDGRAAPNGQLWLKVRGATLPKVFLQYQTGDAAAVVALRRRFAAIPFIVPAAQQLPQAAGKREVRFCYDDDRKLAKQVAAIAVAAIGGDTLATRWIGSDKRCTAISAPRTIELWIGTIP